MMTRKLYIVLIAAYLLTMAASKTGSQPVPRQEPAGGFRQSIRPPNRGPGRRGGRQPNPEQRRRQGPRPQQQIVHPTGPSNVVAEGAELQTLGNAFQFTEGPAANAHGEVFFTDVRISRIYRISLDGRESVWRENTAGANGLYFDRNGSLVVCESENGRVISISSEGEVTVLADKYNGKRFNKPNDLWIDPQGGVYFTDPAYGRDPVLYQDGEHVYYITPDRKTAIRVIDDLVKPNGLILLQLAGPSRLLWLRLHTERARISLLEHFHSILCRLPSKPFLCIELHSSQLSF